MGFFSDFFKSKKISQQPMETPQQLAAKQLLLALAQGGDIGGFRAGEAFGGSLGDFSMTPTEQITGSGILNRVTGAPNQNYLTASSNLNRLASAGFDQNDPEFNAFQRRLTSATGEANDVLNRESAITGDRFGTAILGEKRRLATDQSDILTQKLGELFNRAQDRSLQASGELGRLGLLQDENRRADEGFALAFGQLERSLRDAEAKAKLNEFIRQREERLGAISGLSGVTQNVQYGVREIETQSPFSQLLNTALEALVKKKIGG